MRVYVSLAVIAAAAGVCAAETTGRNGKEFLYTLKLERGCEYSIRQTIENKIALLTDDVEQNTKQAIGFGYGAAVTEAEADGSAWVRFTYDWMRFCIDSADQQIDYDSDNIRRPVPKGAEPYAAILGQAFYARITPEGRIERINGLDAMISHVRAKLPPGAAREATSRNLKQQFNESVIKELFENCMAVYPPQPVRVGESWHIIDNITGPLPLIFETDYSLADRKDGSATIEGRTTIQSDPRYARSFIEGVIIEHTVSGKQHKKARIQETTGEILDSRIERDTVEHFKVPSAGTRPQGLPETISRNTVITFQMNRRPEGN